MAEWRFGPGKGGSLEDFPPVQPDEFVKAIEMSHAADSPVRAKLAGAYFRMLYKGIATDIGNAIDDLYLNLTPTGTGKLELMVDHLSSLELDMLEEATVTRPRLSINFATPVMTPFVVETLEIEQMERMDQTPTVPRYLHFVSLTEEGEPVWRFEEFSSSDDYTPTPYSVSVRQVPPVMMDGEEINFEDPNTWVKLTSW